MGVALHDVNTTISHIGTNYLERSKVKNASSNKMTFTSKNHKAQTVICMYSMYITHAWSFMACYSFIYPLVTQSFLF